MYSVHINDLWFEWDENKATANKLKHKGSFEEAQTVFLDENAIRFLIRITPKKRIVF